MMTTMNKPQAYSFIIGMMWNPKWSHDVEITLYAENRMRDIVGQDLSQRDVRGKIMECLENSEYICTPPRRQDNFGSRAWKTSSIPNCWIIVTNNRDENPRAKTLVVTAVLHDFKLNAKKRRGGNISKPLSRQEFHKRERRCRNSQNRYDT